MSTLIRRAATIGALLAVASCGGGEHSPSVPVSPLDSSPVPSTPTGPAVATIAILGATNIQTGTTTQLTAEPKNAAGARVNADVIGWSSSDPTIVAVSANGVANAVRIGNATITATVNGKRGDLAITSMLSPFTFTFAAGTSAADQQTIKDAVLLGSGFIQQTFGQAISTPTTIASATGGEGCDARSGNAAYTGAGSVVFCVSNADWLAFGPIMRQKIVMHELFHVWQFATRWLGGPPPATGAAWIVEGSAELVAYAGVSANGLLSFAAARSCAVKEVADFFQRQPPGLPPLNMVEPIAMFQTTAGPLYPYSMLAMDQLTSARGLIAVKAYGNAVAAGIPWQTAFQNAFGSTTAAFYAQYPSYRGSLPVPPMYQCGEM